MPASSPSLLLFAPDPTMHTPPTRPSSSRPTAPATLSAMYRESRSFPSAPAASILTNADVKPGSKHTWDIGPLWSRGGIEGWPDQGRPGSGGAVRSGRSSDGGTDGARWPRSGDELEGRAGLSTRPLRTYLSTFALQCVEAARKAARGSPVFLPRSWRATHFACGFDPGESRRPRGPAKFFPKIETVLLLREGVFLDFCAVAISSFTSLLVRLLYVGQHLRWPLTWFTSGGGGWPRPTDGRPPQY